MIVLYLLAAHAAGDFVLQTDWMASEKFENRTVRAIHVWAYSLPFVLVTYMAGWSPQRAAALVLVLWVTHFVIDSRRWNEAVPIWYDQALHVIALAIAVAISGWFA